jgi:hypothetical protein
MPPRTLSVNLLLLVAEQARHQREEAAMNAARVQLEALRSEYLCSHPGARPAAFAPPDFGDDF